MAYYIGVDVGGTSIKAGVVDDTGRSLHSIQISTEAAKGQEHGLAQMSRAVREAAKDGGLSLDQISAIGVATPGTMDIPAGVILDPPNLKPWRNVPVRTHIEREFRLPTAFQNDANAAAYGEYCFGAGRGARSMVMFTLGTGIGCGIIIHDMIIEGEHSHGAESGHMIIEMNNARLCGCGRRGCFEAYASATAVVDRAREILEEARGTSSLGQKLTETAGLTAEDVFSAAKVGDAIASRVVEDTAHYLAVGTTNLMHTIDPDRVIYGGGLIATGDWFLDRIRHHVRQLAFPVPAAKTELLYAHLGNDAGIIGAAACARKLVTVSTAG
jgi:glucokinase